jgi:hypothetical protein
VSAARVIESNPPEEDSLEGNPQLDRINVPTAIMPMYFMGITI